jgi:hypothetical protein
MDVLGATSHAPPALGDSHAPWAGSNAHPLCGRASLHPHQPASRVGLAGGGFARSVGRFKRPPALRARLASGQDLTPFTHPLCGRASLHPPPTRFAGGQTPFHPTRFAGGTRFRTGSNTFHPPALRAGLSTPTHPPRGRALHGWIERTVLGQRSSVQSGQVSTFFPGSSQRSHLILVRLLGFS